MKAQAEMETKAEQVEKSQPEVALSFGQIETVLASIHAIASDKRVAFAGRLKALQRNGLLSNTGPGRGKSATFSYLEFMRFAIALEYMQAGLPPSDAAEIVRSNWPIFRHSIGYAYYRMVREINDPTEYHPMPSQHLDLAWSIERRAFADLSRVGLRLPVDIGDVFAVNSEVLANTYSSGYFIRQTGVLYTNIIIHAGCLILGSIEQLVAHQYATFGSIFDEILDVETVIEGIKPSTPPWSYAAASFWEELKAPQNIETRARDFLSVSNQGEREAAHKVLSQVLEGGEFDRKAHARIRNIWVANLFTYNDEPKICSTRIGRRVFELLNEMEGGDVDQKA